MHLGGNNVVAQKPSQVQADSQVSFPPSIQPNSPSQVTVQTSSISEGRILSPHSQSSMTREVAESKILGELQTGADVEHKNPGEMDITAVSDVPDSFASQVPLRPQMTPYDTPRE